MPAQKRANEATEEVAQGDNHEETEDEAVSSESDRSRSMSDEEKDEFVVVKLSEVRKEVQCPICLGIIRKTRTVMECLHRFCRECIDKSMRLGNNECPACRAHCASRRSLRDDPNYDALIAALYPDIEKYEEEELALHEEEKTHNKMIQASITQTFQRQTEALGKKRNAKAAAAAFARTQGNLRPSHLRRPRNFRNAGELQVSNDDEDMKDNDAQKDLSSDDEQTETRQTSDENVPEVNRETMNQSGTLAWGKNGQRSNTRVNGKNARSIRLARLVEHLRNSETNYEELEIPLMLVSLDEQEIPGLEQPYLQCKLTLSVKQLCQYVALSADLLADEVEICLVEEPQANIIRGERAVDPHKDKLRVLGDHETFAELITDPDLINCGHLLMAYRKKLLNSDTVVKAEQEE